MTFPGPRERKEPSPPFKDPNPDKDKFGKKVKLTIVGEKLKSKIQEKLKTKFRMLQGAKLQKEERDYINNIVDNVISKYHSNKLKEIQIISNYNSAIYYPDSEDIRLGDNFELKKAINLSSFNVMHSCLNFSPNHKEQLKVTLLHELGHHITNDYDKPQGMFKIFSFLNLDSSGISGHKYDREFSPEGIEKYYTTHRSKDNWRECIAESFVFYETDHYKEKVNPRMIKMFDLMKEGKWKW